MAGLSGEVILPGFVDPHTHLREPGTNSAETIASGSKAALLGGYVLIGDMPNNPGRPTWTEERMLEKQAIAQETAYIPTTFHAGSQPESDNVGELEKMAKISLWLKLYGAPTTGNSQDYAADDFRDIVEEWRRVAPNKPIGFHAGKDNLEDMIDMVAGGNNHPLHIHHITSAKDIEIIDKAKRLLGLQVTCGVCPHHLLKTSHDVRSEGWFARMQPPLTSQTEAEELMEYLARGFIDIIETDHAPHSAVAKVKAEKENPNGIHDDQHTTCFGVPGIEFAAPLLFYQAKRGYISMERLVNAMSERPAEIMGVGLSSSTRVLWDMREYRIGDDDAQSSAAWTPYAGKIAMGVVKELYISGWRLIDNGRIIDRLPRVIKNRGEVI